MEAPPATANVGREDRLQGMLVGLAVGDALGVSTEFRTTIPRQAYTGLIPTEAYSIRFRFVEKPVAPGSVSDDTEMTLVLLTSLLARSGYDREDALKGYLTWCNDGSPMLGKNTRLLMKGVTTVKGYYKRVERLEGAGKLDMSQVQSNGTLMRCSPLCVLSAEERERAIREDCSLTNDNDVNRACSRIHLTVLRLLLEGKGLGDVKRYLGTLLPDPDLPVEVCRVLEAALAREERDVSGRSKGWVCHALYCALYAALHLSSYQEAMDWIIGRHPGSDTDTNASIAGALLGAKLGYTALYREERTRINVGRVEAYFATTPSSYKVASFSDLTRRLNRLYQ
jgi:ADP-ribosyl-[dinitrogen reductase] hydrolase